MRQGTRTGEYINTSKVLDSPTRAPEWVKEHYIAIKENKGVCILTRCKCHEIDAMKDPIIKAEYETKRQDWLKKYG